MELEDVAVDPAGAAASASCFVADMDPGVGSGVGAEGDATGPFAWAGDGCEAVIFALGH